MTKRKSALCVDGTIFLLPECLYNSDIHIIAAWI